jgi:formylglycine-generating enzyme required for sulfatase activity
MLYVNPGTFTMGDKADKHLGSSQDNLQFDVTLTSGYWLGQYPITQAQWQAVMGNNPSHFKTVDQDCPVESVDWNEAMSFCRVLNEQFARDLPLNYQFTLPTEAQWEYACRAGTKTNYYSGNTLEDLDQVAWHEGNSMGQTHPVRGKSSNHWEFFDMHGNVAQWCLDSITDYPRMPSTNWVGTSGDNIKSIRGSSWNTPRENDLHRCSDRSGGEPDTKRPFIGFRLCLSQAMS